MDLDLGPAFPLKRVSDSLPAEIADGNTATPTVRFQSFAMDSTSSFACR
jgi:hypothetical protein